LEVAVYANPSIANFGPNSPNFDTMATGENNLYQHAKHDNLQHEVPTKGLQEVDMAI